MQISLQLGNFFRASLLNWIMHQQRAWFVQGRRSSATHNNVPTILRPPQFTTEVQRNLLPSRNWTKSFKSLLENKIPVDADSKPGLCRNPGKRSQEESFQKSIFNSYEGAHAKTPKLAELLWSTQTPCQPELKELKLIKGLVNRLFPCYCWLIINGYAQFVFHCILRRVVGDPACLCPVGVSVQ